MSPWDALEILGFIPLPDSMPRRLLPLVLLCLVVSAGCDSVEEATFGISGVTAEADNAAVAVTVTFSEAIDPGSIRADRFLVDGGGRVTTADATSARVVRLLVEGLAETPRATYTVTARDIFDELGRSAAEVSGSFQFGRDQYAVGAAFSRLNGDVVLVDLGGARFAIFDPRTGTATSSLPLSSLSEPLMLTPLTAGTLTRSGGNRVHLWASGGSTYGFYSGNGGGAFPNFSSQYDSCAGLGVVGAALTSGLDTGNSDQVYLFDETGTRFTVWDFSLATPTCSGSQASFPRDFLGGGAPLSGVGAAFYDDIAEAYYLFSTDGESYTVFDGATLTFSAALSTLEFGNRTLAL